MIPPFLFRILASQFRHPRGIIGRWVGKQMDELNDKQNDWVISLLDIQPTDRILEIGFGTGKTIKKIVTIFANGRIEGVDISKTMLTVAKKNLKKEIVSGKVHLQWGSAEKLSFKQNAFDKIYAVHVVYFWNDLESICRELRRVVKPGGTVVLYFVSKIISDSNSFIPRSKNEVRDLLKKVGFRPVVCREKQFGFQHGIAILATK